MPVLVGVLMALLGVAATSIAHRRGLSLWQAGVHGTLVLLAQPIVLVGVGYGFNAPFGVAAGAALVVGGLMALRSGRSAAA